MCLCRIQTRLRGGHRSVQPPAGRVPRLPARQDARQPRHRRGGRRPVQAPPAGRQAGRALPQDDGRRREVLPAEAGRGRLGAGGGHGGRHPGPHCAAPPAVRAVYVSLMSNTE